ncbi:MAG: response regulator [Deltaproteobacteria bacterium]|nr:response regulator [Deltaproteobacteria bacterium]
MWRKAIVLDDDRFDCERIRDFLSNQNMDAEVVMNQAKLENALQWWHPDVLVVNPLVRFMDVPAFLGRFREQEGRVPVVLAGAMAEKTLEKWARSFECEASFSTLDGSNKLMARLREVYDQINFSEDSGVGW